MNIEVPKILPPSPFVRATAARLHGDSLLVLDAGAHTGRNSVHMARLGHKVVALTDKASEAFTGAAYACQEDVSGSCKFVVGDIRRIGLAAVFDVVISNEVLHMLSKPQSYTALEELRGLTKPGGVHIVSGYVVGQEDVNDKIGNHNFRPQELLKNYQAANWQVESYQEDFSTVFEHAGRHYVSSLAKIVAVND